MDQKRNENVGKSSGTDKWFGELGLWSEEVISILGMSEIFRQLNFSCSSEDQHDKRRRNGYHLGCVSENIFHQD